MARGTRMTWAPVIPQRPSGILVINGGCSARRATYAARAGAHIAIGGRRLNAGDVTVHPLQRPALALVLTRSQREEFALRGVAVGDANVPRLRTAVRDGQDDLLAVR